MDQLIQTWNALSMRRKIVLVAAVGLTLLAVLMIARMASKPGLSLLYSGLDPAAAGEVVGALEQMGVPSEIRGDAIYVAESERDRVRLSLARDGLPRQGQAGYELLDGMSGFNATSDMFDAAYWRAKEGELARTIVASPGVRSARVHLAVGSRRPFARSASEPSASVTVTMGSGSLGSQQALAIRYMVALAVAGLNPDQVAVIDGRTSSIVLAPGEDNPGQNAVSEAADREIRFQQEIENMLFARVGQDRARVTVTVETDLESEIVTENLIDRDGRAILHSSTEEITDTSSGSEPPVTIAGTTPAGAPAEGGSNESERTETKEQVNYIYPQSQRERVKQPGAIKRVSVAVLVDGIMAEDPASGEMIWQPRPEEELTAIEELVKGIVGFDPARGDIVTIETLQFQPDAAPGELVEADFFTRFLERNALSLIQIGVLAVIAIILALTVLRPLLRKPEPEDALSGELIELDEQGADGLAALEGEPEEPVVEEKPLPEQLRESIAQKPDEAVQLLLEWLEPEEVEAQDEAA